MKRLAIIGSSDLGQLIAYHAMADSHYEVIGFYDDYKEENTVNEIKILGKTSLIEKDFKLDKFDCLMLGIGYKHMNFRKLIFDKYIGSIPFGTIIHTSCYVDKSAIIKEGCFLLPGCILDRNVYLNENVLLNTGCVIAHDSIIESNTFLSPCVSVAGFVNIGECCNIGINTTIIDNINISSNVQTGGGSVIIRNIDLPGLYVGNPARFVR